MIKWWCVFWVGGMALSAFGNTPVAPATPVMDGVWTMTDHQCSSGAHPWDHFNPQIDRLEARFVSDTYSIVNQVDNCTAWSNGHYALRGHVISLSVEQASSNCGPVQGTGNFTYPIHFDDVDTFTIDIGPVQGGVCPAGDLVEDTYQR